MAMSGGSSRLRRLQWAVVAQLSVIGMINYMDRATLAIANPLIRQDMGLSVTQMGFLLSAFPLTYALAQLPLGLIIDRLGARLLIGAGLVVWSLSQCLAGFAGNAAQMWGLRFLLGVGEAPTLPSSTKVVRRWYSPRERGTPVGIFTGANHLGQAIAAPFLTLIMVGLGWRWMFVLMGLAGFVSAAVWFLLYRDPADARLPPSDHAFLVEGERVRDVRQMTFALWRRLFAFRTSWGMFLGVTASSYMGSVYATWLPGYMEMQHHLSITKTGLIITIPYVCSVVGSLFAGWCCDYLIRRGASPLDGGRIPFIAGLVGMAAFTALTAMSQQPGCGHRLAQLRDVLQPALRLLLVGGGQRRRAGKLPRLVRRHAELLRLFGRGGGAGVDGLCGAGHRVVHRALADRRRDIHRRRRDLLVCAARPHHPRTTRRHQANAGHRLIPLKERQP